jgi:polyphenol oxidase
VNQPFHLGGDQIYRCIAFQQFVWQSHGFGTRAANPTPDVTLRQVHSDIVVNAKGAADRQHEGDALITDAVHQTIGVRTADCVPMLLLDAKQKAVAAVHAGWRGTAAGIAACALRKMHNDFGTQPDDVYAAIGPCIRGCCYEVGPEVAVRFVPFFPEWSPVTGKRHVDLADANRRQLEGAGLLESNIFDSGFCTACQIETFFSYRREPDNPGRLVSAITRLG